MKHRLIFFCCILFFQDNYAQDSTLRADFYQQKADSFDNIKDHINAARAYAMECRLRTMIPFKKNVAVNAGYAYAQASMPDSALHWFTKAVKDYGLRNLQWVNSEPVLADMIKLPGYAKLKTYLVGLDNKEHDPSAAKIITSDIDLFWKVYDQYLQDTINAAQRFIDDYFGKGSTALQEYYRLKVPNIGGIKAFVHNLDTMRQFYKDIRQNTLKTASLKDSFRIIFRNLKNWYPDASFPNTIFLIGGWSSGGTSTDYGAIVGVDIFSADSVTHTNELNLWQKNNLNFFSELKHVVAHELIHVQQSNMAGDTMLISSAVKEGLADFLAELISGKNANTRLYTWAVGKEYRIWTDFKAEMFLNRYANWIANSKQETPNHPADLGYWVGYQICKAYYDKATNKKQAVYDMLHIADYKKFLADSGIDEIMMSKK